jgi:copper ion binding protein
MEKVTLKVDGMSCEHCVKAVNNALGELNGVKNIDVSLTEKTVSFVYENDLTPLETIKAAITEEGFTVL